MTARDAARHAAVLGSPVEHSLSPVLHEAGYAALGLEGWSYRRIECDEVRLPGLVRGLGPEWAGLSVTMPGKRAALRFADEVTATARAVGAANTLVPVVAEDGGPRWRADCTDVAGVTGALRAAGYRPAGGPGLVLGAGGTANAAVAAVAEFGLSGVTLVVRDAARAEETVACAGRVGLDVEVVTFDRVSLRALAAEADLVVSTVPAGAADRHAEHLAVARWLFDVVYAPWPTPVGTAVAAAGGRLVTGLDMLLHQAFGQFEQFTGRVAPREAMRDALRAATGNTLPLPLAPGDV
ncbi:shikimate dehydrogenase [Actinoalloteichus cyanogriseus DSM 43889]|uniref:Shikimate dehydrogenase n=1 Tax=Actinoalloteichus caeruleus DSM 43889 TaxID=1120930 RepID=A0ABT1JG40_ACTCY|nr:shikimate dehydrogenase [Actinoalloteichus caeruleus DSM 43889]